MMASVFRCSLPSWFLVAFTLTHFLASAAPFSHASSPDLIPDHYVFVMRKDLSASDWESHQDWSSSLAGKKKWVYNSEKFKGYCGNFTQEAVEKISASDAVDVVEPDRYVEASAFVAQANAPWGLSRISQRQFESNLYTFDDSAGNGTFSYIIDSGINTAHLEFEGRATLGADFVNDGQHDDLAGHGTHVAGTIGSRAFGVAKKTQLIGVRVLNKDGVGGMGDVLAGLDWVVRDATAKGRLGKTFVNLSLDGPFSNISNTAVASAVKAGVFVGVAAGNDAKSAALFSPASAQAACTIGATAKDDSMASFSNFGSAVDVFGPGVGILSTWIGSTTATNTLSGTSMASPHVVGLAAYLAGLQESPDPSQLCESIKKLSTSGAFSSKVASSQDSPLVVYNGNGR